MEEIKEYKPVHWLLIAFSILLVILVYLSTSVQQNSTNVNKEKERKVNKKDIIIDVNAISQEVFDRDTTGGY